MRDIFSNIEQQIENIDAKIEDIMKNATDSKSYEKLNQTINDMVDNSTNAFEKGYERAEKVVKDQAEKFKTSFESQQENLKKHTESFKKPPVRPTEKSYSNNSLFAKKDISGGMALAIIGFIFAGLTFIGVFATAVLSSIPVAGSILVVVNRVVLIPLFIIFLLMGIGGNRMIARARRFKKYIHALNGKMYESISDLAAAVNRSESFTRRDVKKMISANWFKQGRLTEDQQTLIVCKDTYSEYQETKRRTFEEEQRREEIQNMHAQLPEQARMIIQRGEDFIKDIHEKKVAISEYEMTIKLSNLESILKKIFARVEKHPEAAPQMRKMMDYYLPTTIKLLEAYVQLDKQAVQGVNILSAKTEIEESLDTLIMAYEKLLDDLFEDVMLDVSTDISVLNTMLVQDGLTDSEFGNIKKEVQSNE